MTLPPQPSYFWQLSKGAILTGGTIPLHFAMLLRPLEMQLIYQRALVLKYAQWERLLEQLRAQLDHPIPGLSLKASQALRGEQIAELSRRLTAYKKQRSEALPVLREAMQLGYF